MPKRERDEPVVKKKSQPPLPSKAKRGREEPTVKNDQNKKQKSAPAPAAVPAKVAVTPTDDLQVGDTIWIRKFPMETLNTKVDGKRVLIVGMSGSGKSTVALDIIRYNKDIPVWMCISPSESRNHTFGPHMHPLWIHDDLVLEEVENLKKRQESRGEAWQIPNTKPTQYYRDISAGLIMDDCNISPKMFKEDVFNWIYFNSRHDKVLVLMLTQYFMLVPISHRRNLSHLFLFRQNSPKEMKKIWEEFAAVFPTFAEFRKAMEICTAERRCMVIDILSSSTRVQDRVFWYKAPRFQPEFKAGADWAWKQSDMLYEKEWKKRPAEEPVAEAPPPVKQPRGKKAKAVANSADAEVKLLDENGNPLTQEQSQAMQQ